MTTRSFLFSALVAVTVLPGCRREASNDRPDSLRRRFIQLAESRAEKKDASAHIYLGWTYATGSGVVKDQDHALQHLAAAAKSKVPLAIRLQKICQANSATQMDELVGEIRRGAAANDMNAKMIIATWLIFGEGVTKDPREARRLLQISAQQGNNFARRALALLAESGSN